MNSQTLLEELETILAGDQPLPDKHSQCLARIAREWEARTATLHRADSETRMIHMVASIGIPEGLKRVTEVIPFGKGMAGICVQRGEPVTVCNLQTDASGVAKPGAKETEVAGAIVIPIRGEESGPILGTLGIGKPEEHTYTPEETDLLVACARLLAETL
jgi:signal transduction protein with GAF and PtsI domain